MTDDDYEEDTMKNKKFIALLAMTVALSGVMTACSFGGGKEDSVVVELYLIHISEPTRRR